MSNFSDEFLKINPNLDLINLLAGILKLRLFKTDLCTLHFGLKIFVMNQILEAS